MKTKLTLVIAVLAVTFSFAQEKKWTLKECVDYALENNISIKQNEYNIEISNEDVTTAKGNFLPNLSASASGSFNSGLSPDQFGILQQTDNINSNFNASAGGTIFNGFRNLNTYKQSKLGVESSKLTLEQIEADISLNVVNAFLNILFAKENLNVAKVQYEISYKQIERAQGQVEAGTRPKAELLNVQSTAINDEQNIVTQENALDLALLNLAQLLQVDPEGFDITAIQVDSPSALLLYDDSSSIFEIALNSRPEIALAKLNVENSNLGIEIAKGAYLPSLSYSLSAGTSYFNQLNNLPPGFENPSFSDQISDRFSYRGGLSLSIPIFSRGQVKANVNRAKINRSISELSLKNEELQLRQIIEQAFLDSKAAAKTFIASEKSLEAQKEAFKNAQERYNLGAMTLFDFDQVRNRLVNAESTMIRAKYDYIFKTKVLKFYNNEPILD